MGAIVPVVVRRSLLLSCGIALGVSLACGARTGLPTGAAACTGVPVGLVRQVPNLYFVLDRSGSMLELTSPGATTTKWSVVQGDIADLIATLGDDARFGAAWFPAWFPEGTGFDPCAAGDEILAPRLGDGQRSTVPGSTAAAFLAATDETPYGGTPTAATFLALTPELAGLEGHTFAILATDGGPNCNRSLTCGIGQCTLNIDGKCEPPDGTSPNCCSAGEDGSESCLDGARTVAAVRALAAAGVPTFVIGVPGSEAYATILDQVAVAGGTARASEPFYYPVNTASSSSLVDALASIAARIAASCRLELVHATTPGDTNVIVEGRIVPASGPDGWTLSGGVVTLLGATCDTVRAEGQKVVVTEGCATRVK
jgi:hypothetical protein